MLSKNQILSIDDRPIQKVNIPEWNGTVNVRAMSAADIMDLQAIDDIGKQTALTCARVIVDGNKNRLFTDEDADLLSQKSPASLMKIMEVAQHISGMGDDLEKN